MLAMTRLMAHVAIILCTYMTGVCFIEFYYNEDCAVSSVKRLLFGSRHLWLLAGGRLQRDVAEPGCRRPTP